MVELRSPVSRSRRQRRSRLLRWLAVAVIGVIAFAYVHPVRSYLHARDQVEARQAELRTLERESRRHGASASCGRGSACSS